jgi:sugar/nucleoside kinase (ribokinase family)
MNETQKPNPASPRAANFVCREQARAPCRFYPPRGPRRRDAGPVHLGRRVAHFAGSAGAGVDFERESFMPGGAANVARNLTALNVPTELFGAIGNDDAARKTAKTSGEQKIGCTGLVKNSARHTSVKTRIVAHKQQVVRIDRETRDGWTPKLTAGLLAALKTKIPARGGRHRRRLRQGRRHAAAAGRNQIALPRARRVVEPRSQAGASFEFERAFAHHAEPQGGV